MSVPNHFPVVQAVFARGGFDLSIKEGCGLFTEACASELHKLDPNFGHLRKRPAQNQYNGHAVDAILYRATGDVVDLIASSESADARVIWLVKEDGYAPDVWYAPEPLPAPPSVPAPPPAQSVPPVDPAPILAAIAELSANLAALRTLVEQQQPAPAYMPPGYIGKFAGFTVTLNPRGPANPLTGITEAETKLVAERQP